MHARCASRWAIRNLTRGKNKSMQIVITMAWLLALLICLVFFIIFWSLMVVGVKDGYWARVSRPLSTNRSDLLRRRLGDFSVGTIAASIDFFGGRPRCRFRTPAAEGVKNKPSLTKSSVGVYYSPWPPPSSMVSETSLAVMFLIRTPCSLCGSCLMKVGVCISVFVSWPVYIMMVAWWCTFFPDVIRFVLRHRTKTTRDQV